MFVGREKKVNKNGIVNKREINKITKTKKRRNK